MAQFEINNVFPFVHKVVPKVATVVKQPGIGSIIVGGIMTGAKVGAMCTGGVACAAGVGYLLVRLAAKRSASTRIAALDETLACLDKIVADGNEYNPALRDCDEGEHPDLVVEEEEVVELPAPTGGEATKVRATRRRKKKVVHTPYEGGVVSGAYLGDVVARARNIYNAGPSDHYHRALARAYMVRLMTEHNMRPSHINQHIDLMGCAVFHKNSVQYNAEGLWDTMIRRQQLGKVDKGWF